ncbi:hypothetical protein ALP71_200094 [Pseudomonas coronafaciens pv. garcae]|nr:hypothetical protein ALP71_200094 [Pseudomonas coronafaciens pv. garcae]
MVCSFTVMDWMDMSGNPMFCSVSPVAAQGVYQF